MKKTTLTAFAALLCILVHAQLNLHWAHKIDKKVNYSIIPTSTTVDNKGNMYTIGQFSGTVDFNPGPAVFNMTAKIVPNAAGSIMLCTDIFVTKFDMNGNFIWAKQWGDISGDIGNAITVDATGNIYTTGVISLTGSYAAPRMFIHKLDKEGNLKWEKTVYAGQQQSIGHSIALDASGNIYAAGYTGGTQINGYGDFDPGPAVAIPTGGNIYVLKLNNNGEFIWVKGLGGKQSITGFYSNYHVAVDLAGNVYTTGRFKNTGDFDPGAGTKNITAKGGNDIFISKLNSSGNFVWIKQLGGTGEDISRSIAVLNDRVYITGSFTGIGAFDPNSNNKNLVSSGGTDIFITKLDTDGNFKWARRMGAEGNDVAYAVAVDDKNDVYLTGAFEGKVDFDPKAGDNNKFYLTSKGEKDIFISKLSGAEGEYLLAKQIGGTKEDVANTFCLGIDKSIYIAGEFGGTADFDPNNGVKNLTSTTNSSMFIARYIQPPVIVGTPVPVLLPEINVKVNNTDILSGDSHSFGTVPVNTNKDVVFTIQNTGNSILNLTSIEVTGLDFIKTGVAPANMVNSGASVNLTIRMKASNLQGNKTGQLIIKNNDNNEAVYVINLKGIVEDIIEKALPGEETQRTGKNSAITSSFAQLNVVAYPNPTHAGWQISFTKNITNSIYTLFDKQGKTIAGGIIKERTFYLPAEKLSSGMYFLRIHNGGTKSIIRLIKN